METLGLHPNFTEVKHRKIKISIKYDLKSDLFTFQAICSYPFQRKPVPLTVFLVIYVVKEKSILVWMTEVKSIPEGERCTKSVGFYMFTQGF